MASYLFKKIFYLLITVIGVITLVFFLIHFIPGDPVELLLGETAQATDIEEVRQDFDDYLFKPIEFKELSLKINRILEDKRVLNL